MTGGPHRTEEKNMEGHVNASLTNWRAQGVAHNSPTRSGRYAAAWVAALGRLVLRRFVIAFTGSPHIFFGCGP